MKATSHRPIGPRCFAGALFVLAVVLSVSHAAAVPPLVELAQDSRPGRDRPARGKFLVASRDLLDPNFARTVVLLVDYSSDGALGVIVNRPTEMPAASFLPQMPVLQERDDPIWFGGPVAPWKAVILGRSEQPLDEAQKVFEDVVFTGSKRAVERLIAADGHFRLFAGYAGWAAGQLDAEIDRGGWRIFPATVDAVFDSSPLDLWSRLSSVQWTGLDSESDRILTPGALTRGPMPEASGDRGTLLRSP